MQEISLRKGRAFPHCAAAEPQALISLVYDFKGSSAEHLNKILPELLSIYQRCSMIREDTVI